jgi:hypothetical protein
VGFRHAKRNLYVPDTVGHGDEEHVVVHDRNEVELDRQQESLDVGDNAEGGEAVGDSGDGREVEEVWQVGDGPEGEELEAANGETQVQEAQQEADAGVGRGG